MKEAAQKNPVVAIAFGFAHLAAVLTCAIAGQNRRRCYRGKDFRNIVLQEEIV
jgi:hypothetical protein